MVEWLPYRVLGARNRPALVFLHGFLGRGDDWLPLAEPLSTDWCCILPDLPGHGQAQHLWLDPYRGFAHVHRLLVGLLERLNIAEYRMLGYSMGGRIGLYHAMQQPNGLGGLWLESAAPGLDGEARPARWLRDRRQARAFASRPMPLNMRHWLNQPLFDNLSRAQKHRLCSARQGLDGNVLGHSLMALSLARQPDARHWLVKSPLPVQWVFGTADRKFSQLGTCLRALGVRDVRPVPSCGHNIHFENPEACLNLIRPWLRQGAQGGDK